MTSLADLDAKLRDLGKQLEHPRVVRAAGMAAKRSVITVAEDVAGGDRRVSGWGRRGVLLGVGFDESPGQVAINLRPAGVWKVMESGRKGGKTVTPRKRSGRKAVLTPHGPRRSFVLGATQGKRAVTRAGTAARDAAPKAATNELARMVKEVF